MILIINMNHFQFYITVFKPIFASAKICINPNADVELKSPKAKLHLEVQNIAVEMNKLQVSSALTQSSLELFMQTTGYAMHRLMSVWCELTWTEFNTIFSVPVCGRGVGVSRPHGKKFCLQEVQTRRPCKQTCQAVVSNKCCWYRLVIISLLFIYQNDYWHCFAGGCMASTACWRCTLSILIKCGAGLI